MLRLFLLFPLLLFAEDPIHFLTWQEDPLHTMTLVWLTKEENCSDIVDFRKGDEEEWTPKMGRHHFVTLEEERYKVHLVEFRRLDPGELYQFRFGKEGQSHSFLTAPVDLEEELSFFVGGDAYHDDKETLRRALSQAAKKDPLFGVVAGDIAYAFRSKQSKKEEGKRWLTFFETWQETMVTGEGRVIPLLTTIGNHDVMGGFNQSKEAAKSYYALFPLANRQPYGSLDFSNYMTLLLLDSGHTHPVEGKQTNWLKKELEKSQETPYLFAIYHVGAYPSYRSPTNNRAQKLRQNWIPLFEKYKITASFEHHDHTLKRTHPIKNMKIDEEGVTYLGDGSLGTKKPRELKKNLPWYICEADSAQGFWWVKIGEKGAHFEAVDAKGEVLDQFDKTLNRAISPPTKELLTPSKKLIKKNTLLRKNSIL